MSCKYCTHRVKVCRGAHLRFVIMVYIAEDTSRSPFPDMFYVSVSCLAQVFLSPQAEESGSMSSVQEFCTNADSECFSDKSLSPNWTTNPHQSDSDRCRSKYDLKITMFTSENVQWDAIQFFCTSKNPEILHWNSAGAAKTMQQTVCSNALCQNSRMLYAQQHKKLLEGGATGTPLSAASAPTRVRNRTKILSPAWP